MVILLMVFYLYLSIFNRACSFLNRFFCQFSSFGVYLLSGVKENYRQSSINEKTVVKIKSKYFNYNPSIGTNITVKDINCFNVCKYKELFISHREIDYHLFFCRYIQGMDDYIYLADRWMLQARLLLL